MIIEDKLQSCKENKKATIPFGFVDSRYALCSGRFASIMWAEPGSWHR
jgi:hypothetical protein